MKCFVCQNEVTKKEIAKKKSVTIIHKGKKVIVHLNHHGIKELVTKTK